MCGGHMHGVLERFPETLLYFSPAGRLSGLQEALPAYLEITINTLIPVNPICAGSL